MANIAAMSSKMQTARPNAAIAWSYAALGGLLVAACYVFGTPEVVSWGGSFFGLAAAPVIVGAALVYRLPRAWAWHALALGVLLQGLGDLVWSALSPNGVDSIPVPSLADAVYLAGYAALLVGLIALLRRDTAEGELAMVVDVGIVSIGIGLLAWVLLIEPALVNVEMSPLELVVTASYPLLDVALIGALVRQLLTSRRPSTSIALLAVALLSFVASDVVYLRGTIDGTYVAGGIADLGWLAGYVLWGAAALHPSARYVSDVEASGELPGFSVWRAAMLAAACLVAPLTLAWTWGQGLAEDVPVIVAASAAMIPLWALRVTVTVRRLREVLDERGSLEIQLRDQAARDPLVGLWNRAAFRERLAEALAAGGGVGVLYLDVDDFKVINDTHGHSVGDAALVQIAARVSSVLRPADVAARVGGDEFAVLLPSADVRLGEAVGRRILEALYPPLILDGRSVRLRASVGVSCGDRRIGAEELMREADVAMYLAKGQGKARVQVFQAAMHESVLRRIALRSEMENAIAAGEFVLLFQPIVSTSTRTLIACEALCRWSHPERGTLAPVEFIGLAEETGLIVPLGRHVLREACREARAWAEIAEEAPPAVTVNVSAVQFRHPAFLEDVAAIVRETGINPRRLILEVTESTLIDVDDAPEIIAGLQAEGIRIAVDDFGTGYSSLAYLSRYPINIVKIDRAFVAALGVDERDDRLAAAIVNLSHDLRMQVIAEGVETEAQLARLRQLGCGSIQGYLVARPLPAPGIRALIEKWRAWPGDTPPARPARLPRRGRPARAARRRRRPAEAA